MIRAGGGCGRHSRHVRDDVAPTRARTRQLAGTSDPSALARDAGTRERSLLVPHASPATDRRECSPQVLAAARLRQIGAGIGRRSAPAGDGTKARAGARLPGTAPSSGDLEDPTAGEHERQLGSAVAASAGKEPSVIHGAPRPPAKTDLGRRVARGWAQSRRLEWRIASTTYPWYLTGPPPVQNRGRPTRVSARPQQVREQPVIPKP